MVEQLLPCPFCGGEARLFPVIIPFDADCDAITVQCSSCDAIGANVLVDQDVHGICDLASLELDAIAAWNTRLSSAPASVEGLREALFEALHVLERLRDLTPMRANEITAAGMHGAVRAIVEGPLDRLTAAIASAVQGEG